jgi:hypothetical protein
MPDQDWFSRPAKRPPTEAPKKWDRLLKWAAICWIVSIGGRLLIAALGGVAVEKVELSDVFNAIGMIAFLLTLVLVGRWCVRRPY